ncbi:glycosyltransferase [Bacillus megaterium]|uniref:glycosyltransferase family 4 protein n=1 Tax=Priestia megaterium TaxID=1404 RepID=UPI00129311A7|nr:glycosyltransferase family 4 protein [Priestia megaterium]MQR87685.1 glycosyltransferase [Priestia megaterium]
MSKILHIFPELGGGGTEDVILKITNYISYKSDIKIAICAETESGIRASDFQKANIELFNIPFLCNKKKIFRNLINLNTAIKKFKPQLIHTHSLYVLVLAYIIKKISKIDYRIIHTGHGGPRANYDQLATRLIWMVDKYITISKYSYEYIIQKCQKEKVELIYNGTEAPKDFEIVDNKLAFEKLKMVFIGRLTHQKGLTILIEAIEKLHKKGFDFKVIVIGSGEEHDNLERMIKEKKLESSFEFKGYVKEPWAEISDYPVVVMPSLWEPGGLVAIEAIVRNHTIIGSNIQGLKDTINDGENGYIFEAGNSEDLAAKILYIYSNHKYINLSIAERDKYLFENRTGPKYLKLYKKILSEV